MQEKERAM